MNNQDINDHVVALLDSALIGDLSLEHAALIALLKADKPKVAGIVLFLFNGSRVIASPVFAVEHTSPRWEY